jgi:hypothetical protein
VTDRREDLRAIFDVKNPKEVGQDPFAVRRPGGKPHGEARGDERWNAIPSMRQDLANTSAPDRLENPVDYTFPDLWSGD